MSPGVGVAIEKQTCVETCDRQRTRGRLVLADGDVIELVLGAAPGDGRFDEISRPVEVERRGRHQVRPPAGDSGRALEVHDLGLEPVSHQLIRAEAVVGAGRNPRRSCVRAIGGCERVIDRLVLLRLRVDAPVLVAIRKRRATLDEGGAGALGALGEVLEVLAVAQVRGVDRELEVAGQLGRVLEPDTAAGVAVDAIVRQVVPAQLAVLVLRHPTQIAADIHAPARVDVRLEGEVGVGRYVPVERDGELGAAARALPQARKQKAALALVAQRKGHPGEVHDRHVAQVDARVVTGTHACAGVERDVGCAQLPGLIGCRARSEPHTLEVDDALGCELHRVGRTACRALSQLELGILELGSTLGRVVAAAAGDVNQRVDVIDVTLGLDGAGLAVVVELVRLDRAITLSDDDVTLEDRVAVEVEGESVAVGVDSLFLEVAAFGPRACRRGYPGSGRRRSGGACWCGGSQEGQVRECRRRRCQGGKGIGACGCCRGIQRHQGATRQGAARRQIIGPDGRRYGAEGYD